MRWLAFFMAILVLALSFFPCADGIAMPEKAKKEIATRASLSSDDDHEDNCSPFCHCSCCANFSIHHQVAELTSPAPPFHTGFASHYAATVMEVSIPVWQPPKLS